MRSTKKDFREKWEERLMGANGNELPDYLSQTYHLTWKVSEYTIIDGSDFPQYRSSMPELYRAKYGKELGDVLLKAEFDAQMNKINAPGGIIVIKLDPESPENSYRPLEHQRLFLEFANINFLDPKGILDFCNQWGHLGLSCFNPDYILALHVYGRLVWIGDRILDVQNEILQFNHLLRLKIAIDEVGRKVIDPEQEEAQNKSKEYLKTYIHGNEVMVPVMEHGDEVKRVAIRLPDASGALSPEEVAHRYIINTVSRYIKGWLVPVPVVQGPKEAGLVYQFKLLINAIYFQFFNHMQKGKGLRVCLACGMKFIPGQSGTWRCERCRHRLKIRKYRETKKIKQQAKK